jgi:hypothetical protein
LVKRSAIISLIALSELMIFVMARAVAGGSGKSKQQNPIWRRNLNKYL